MTAESSNLIKYPLHIARTSTHDANFWYLLGVRVLRYSCEGRPIMTLMIITFLNIIDSDKVDFDLFLKMVLGYTRREDPEVEMKEAFSVFDSNKDGVINSEEMRSVFSNLGNRLTDAEVAALIREADIDGDGLVDYNGEWIHNADQN